MSAFELPLPPTQELPQEKERDATENRGSFWVSWIFALFVFLVMGALTVGAFRPRLKVRAAAAEDAAEQAVPAVAVIHPERGAPVQEMVLPANLQAFTDAPIYARTNGYLKRWLVDIGEHVKSGQLLAEIETPELDQQSQQGLADLATAQANLRLAQITADRYQGLLNSHSVSQQDADNATGNLEARRSAVQSAQHNVKRLEELQGFEKIYAPFDGVITARNTDIGALINSGSSTGTVRELFHIAATTKLRAYVNVPQSYWPAAKPGLHADLTLPEFPNRRFPGVLVRAAEAIDTASGTMLMEVDVDNADGELKPGAYAEMRLKLPSKASSYFLPINALLFRSEGMQIVTVNDGVHAKLNRIVIGRDFGTKVEVVSGLRGDDTVVINPPDSLTSGQTLRVTQTEPNRRMP